MYFFHWANLGGSPVLTFSPAVFLHSRRKVSTFKRSAGSILLFFMFVPATVFFLMSVPVAISGEKKIRSIASASGEKKSLHTEGSQKKKQKKIHIHGFLSAKTASHLR